MAKWTAGTIRPLGSLVAVTALAGLVLFVVATGGWFSTGSSQPAASPAASRTSGNTERLEARTASSPDDLAAWQQLGVAYVTQAAATGDPSYYDLADRALDRAEQLEPGAPVTVVARGNLALALHRFDEALELGRRAHELLPSNPDALGVVVDAQVELGRYEEAAKTTQAMLDVDPGLPALARTSYLRQLHGDLDGALAAMQQAETAGAGLPFETATVTALVGDLAVLRGDLDAAAGAYRRALQTSPDAVLARVGLARIRAIQGDVDGAISDLEELTAAAPHPAALLLLLDLQEHAGRGDEAGRTEELVRAIVALQRNASQTVALELALFEADHGDPAEAVRLAEAAYAARPDNVYAADALAWALYRNGEVDEAVGLAERSLRLDTADPVLRFHGAAVHAAAGNEVRARELLASAIERQPWFSFGLIEEARRLAEELELAAPDAWSAP